MQSFHFLAKLGIRRQFQGTFNAKEYFSQIKQKMSIDS